VANLLLLERAEIACQSRHLLCPVDFSPLSCGALHYALAIARRFHARLVVQTVDDPLLAEVGDTRLGEGWSRANSETQLRAMVAEAEQGFPAATCSMTFGSASRRRSSSRPRAITDVR
jgi:nucleotide-binding universal stress UspA family protein